MITPERIAAGLDVARHYDELDRFYLDVWGEHVHHGLWLSGRERPEDAVRQLVDLVALSAPIAPGDTVCDIGAGYGATARQLASEFGAQVTALTISARQHEYALSHASGRENPAFLHGDFLQNDFPSGQFDVACAIECASHMSDPKRFAEEVERILKPGGRFVMCAWAAAERASDLQIRYLLEPICREGRLAHLMTPREYLELLETAGLRVRRFRDLSAGVRRTWSLVLRRTFMRLLSRRSYLEFLLQSSSDNRIFVLTILRLWIAYRVDALRYCMFVCGKPGSGGAVPAKLA